MKELKTEHKLYLERLNNTQIVDLKLDEYLRESIKSETDKNTRCIGWDYLKTNLTRNLRDILLNPEYENITYNSENITFILNYLNNIETLKITEELNKQLCSFVYVWKDIKRELDKKEAEENLRKSLLEKGFRELDFLKYKEKETEEEFKKRSYEYYKQFDGLKVVCVLDVNAIGLMDSFDKKAEIEGRFFYSEHNNSLMLIPKICRTRGHIIKGKCYFKEV